MELTPEQEKELAARYEAARPDVTQTLLEAQANIIKEAYFAELAAKAASGKVISSKPSVDGGV